MLLVSQQRLASRCIWSVVCIAECIHTDLIGISMVEQVLVQLRPLMWSVKCEQ